MPHLQENCKDQEEHQRIERCMSKNTCYFPHLTCLFDTGEGEEVLQLFQIPSLYRNEVTHPLVQFKHIHTYTHIFYIYFNFIYIMISTNYSNIQNNIFLSHFFFFLVVVNALVQSEVTGYQNWIIRMGLPQFFPPVVTTHFNQKS